MSLVIDAIASKITRHLRYLLVDTSCFLGLQSAEKAFRHFGARILVYHGIDKTGRLDLNSRFISAKALEQHVRFLSEHANVITLDDFFQQKFDPQRFNIAITFDDGYQNNRDYALPVLEQFRIPATFFITPARLAGNEALWMDLQDIAAFYGPDRITVLGEVYDRRRRGKMYYYADRTGQRLAAKARQNGAGFAELMMAALWQAVDFRGLTNMADYWKLLDADSIRQLAASPLVTIGAHGVTHLDMSMAQPEALKTELILGKQLLENCIGKPVFQLAFPFGAYNEQVINQARLAGYTQQYALDYFPSVRQDAEIRPRMVINPYVSHHNLWLSVKRGYF